ncbi:hypothetical protein QYE76_053833 [Lolium multiflorum]|uniref:Uncharacterized protein n=1 Tax=Lolium multiflorum TaxID=4521 RepID=A0AAD8SX56_LOLMU|nr:hypothetical protein QYE76_053833 [Lolium multiflorum]
MQGKAPRVSYEINGNAYDKPYYLADGIYPDWATLVKTVRNPNSEKTRRFAKMQEACRKDVERGFGVLQAWWVMPEMHTPWLGTPRGRYDAHKEEVFLEETMSQP